MRFTKILVAAAAFISGVAVCGSTQAQSVPSAPANEGFSAAAPGPGETGWTVDTMRHAQPLPTPQADPDRVRAEARMARQPEFREAHPPGSTESYAPPHR
jgi:hypothetical protein